MTKENRPQSGREKETVVSRPVPARFSFARPLFWIFCSNEIAFFFFQKTEPWETEVSNEDQDSDEEEDKIPEKRPKRRKQLKLVDGVLYRVNQYGKYFKYFINVKD